MTWFNANRLASISKGEKNIAWLLSLKDALDEKGVKAIFVCSGINLSKIIQEAVTTAKMANNRANWPLTNFHLKKLDLPLIVSVISNSNISTTLRK